MIVYNVTVKIDLDVHDLWLRWIKEEHIPLVTGTGCFTTHKMYRILEENTSDGISYCIQYFANHISDYFTYKETFEAPQQKEIQKIFPGKFITITTLLKEV